MDKTILVVEDQDDLRLLIRLTLRPLGRVAACTDLHAVAAQVEAECPQLVVLDVWLGPGLSGLDICRAIKEGAHPPKVLMLSACGQQSDIEAGLAAGADRYVVKPFSPESLVQAAQALLAD
jgi:two-component system phosphate regulon response regulator PhoB